MRQGRCPDVARRRSRNPTRRIRRWSRSRMLVAAEWVVQIHWQPMRVSLSRTLPDKQVQCSNLIVHHNYHVILPIILVTYWDRSHVWTFWGSNINYDLPHHIHNITCPLQSLFKPIHNATKCWLAISILPCSQCLSHFTSHHHYWWSLVKNPTANCCIIQYQINHQNKRYGFNSNLFHKFWWVILCKHPWISTKENICRT